MAADQPERPQPDDPDPDPDLDAGLIGDPTDGGDPAGYADDDGGRQRVRITAGPAAVRLLTAALDGRIIPNTYVADGTPVVIEAVSGAPRPLAGDETAPLPLSVSPLRPPLLGHLLAQHAHVVRREQTRDGQWVEVETRPGQTVLAEVLAPRCWPGLPPLRGMIGAPVLRPPTDTLDDLFPGSGCCPAFGAHMSVSFAVSM